MIPLTTEGRRIRRDTIALAQENGGYHFGGSFSVVEILLAYFRAREAHDVLVFSKGHACWPFYVMLRDRGLKPVLEGHPKRDPANGVTWTTGSLGHGLPAALGIAMARRAQGKPGRVFCVIGDGDLQAGTFWESVAIAGKHGVDNLCVIYDSNKIQGSGFVDDILPTSAAARVTQACNWLTRACDGHNIDALVRLIGSPCAHPMFVTATTIKGRGVDFMEGRPEWHARGLNTDETAAALTQLS